MSQKRPHLVIFNPDEWRGDVLGHMGNKAAYTPNLDNWVETDAVSFRYAYAQNPVSTPSRVSFMTGWYPHVRGHRTMHHMLRPDEPCLLKTLKELGYFVWWGGKNDLVQAQVGYEAYCNLRYDPTKSGRPLRPLWATDRQEQWRGVHGSNTYYSFYVGQLETADGGPYYDHDWAVVNGALEQIRAWGERVKNGCDQPLCIYMALLYPHPPYAVEEPWFSMIDRANLPGRVPAPSGRDAAGKPSMLAGIRERQGLQGWAEERWDELRATYYGMCARVDHQFGLVLDALKQAGLYDETAVLFFSDHGDFTGDYGLVEKNQNTFEDCLTRVPLVVKPMARVPARPRVSEAMVELVDVPATIEALLGLNPTHTHFGRSLLSVVSGEREDHREEVFSEGGRLEGERQAMELESKSDQQPSGLYWPRVGLQATAGSEHTKAAMCRTRDFKYVRRLYEQDELYDLRDDEYEQYNVVADRRYAHIRAEMSERLLTWYQATCDVVPLVPDQRS